MFSAPKPPPVPKPPPPPPSLADPNIFRAGQFLKMTAGKQGFASLTGGGKGIFKAAGGIAQPMGSAKKFAPSATGGA